MKTASLAFGFALGQGFLLTPMCVWGQDKDLRLANPGFENRFEGWSVQGPDNAVSISRNVRAGEASAKIESKDGAFQQSVTFPENGLYTFSIYAKGSALIGATRGDRIYFHRSERKKDFQPVSVTFRAEAGEEVVLFLGFSGSEVRYDEASLRLTPAARESASIARRSHEAEGSADRLVASVPPSQNFDLLGWNLSVPTDEDQNGRSDTISERALAAGYEDPRFFFTAPDGGMVFRAPIAGARTSNNTKFTRVELREMLRRGDTSIKTRLRNGKPSANNWVLSSAPEEARRTAGGVDGVLEATLKIDYVPQTGNSHDIGRVIIGQIHAKDDEPIRLYYRKLPQNERGSIYFAHEMIGRPDDIYIDMIGSRRDSAKDPVDGVALGEPFSYRIETAGNLLKVEISKAGKIIASHDLDMTGSGYDVADDFLYFKAGAYNQNRSGDPGEYSQVTFYHLEARH